MENKLNIDEIYQLLQDFFKEKVTCLTISKSIQTIECVLYDSFIFNCDLDERYQTFGCAIILSGLLNEKIAIRSFGNNKISIDNDRTTIINNFKLIDNYCRLRLPDKFLKEFY